MARLGYEITRFDPATPGTQGVIAAERETPNGRRYGTVKISCREKVTFQPVEGSKFLPTFDFSRDVYYALLTAVSQQAAPDATAAAGADPDAATGTRGPVSGRDGSGSLRMIMRPLDRFEVRKATGVDLHGRDLLVVRVVISNQTRRAYRLPAERIVLVTEMGDRAQWLRSPEVASHLREHATAQVAPGVQAPPPIDASVAAEALEKKALTGGRIGPGETRSGLLYFPADDYRSGRMRLIDEETGEIEGTLVSF
jgi:hypothetical protein